MLSWTPSKCRAKGGLKFHVIPVSAPGDTIFSASDFSIKPLKSCSPPTKFVSLSDNISTGSPFQGVLHKKLGM